MTQPAQVPWGTPSTVLTYGAYGKRHVLIICSELGLRDPGRLEAVPRRSGRLTEEDKGKLKSEKVLLEPHDDETAIVRKRYVLDSNKSVFKVLRSDKEHFLSRQEAYDIIAALMNNTEHDGVVLYYIGDGRKDTGDWCFNDGYITFADIANLYLQAPPFNGRVLTVVSDCSYSGCWVTECEKFLDGHGVYACGHKARDKGMLIKVYASCLPTQIPTQYQLIVHGGGNDKTTGDKYTESSKYLLDTQHTFSVNSSRIWCSGTTIDDPCTLKPGYTWQKLRMFKRIHLIRSNDSSRPSWQYIELIDDEEIVHAVKSGRLQASYRTCKVIASGEGKEPPRTVKESINERYGPCHNS